MRVGSHSPLGWCGLWACVFCAHCNGSTAVPRCSRPCFMLRPELLVCAWQAWCSLYSRYMSCSQPAIAQIVLRATSIVWATVASFAYAVMHPPLAHSPADRARRAAGVRTDHQAWCGYGCTLRVPLPVPWRPAHCLRVGGRRARLPGVCGATSDCLPACAHYILSCFVVVFSRAASCWYTCGEVVALN